MPGNYRNGYPVWETNSQLSSPTCRGSCFYKRLLKIFPPIFSFAKYRLMPTENKPPLNPQQTPNKCPQMCLHGCIHITHQYLLMFISCLMNPACMLCPNPFQTHCVSRYMSQQPVPLFSHVPEIPLCLLFDKCVNFLDARQALLNNVV